MSATPPTRRGNSGQTLVKVLVIATIFSALFVVIKTFSYAASCYASAAETLAAIGEDGR